MEDCYELVNCLLLMDASLLPLNVVGYENGCTPIYSLLELVRMIHRSSGQPC